MSSEDITTLVSVVKCFDSKRIPLSSRERESKQGQYPYYGAAGIIDHVNRPLFSGLYLLMGEDGSVIKEDGTPVLQLVSGEFWVNNHAHVLQGETDLDTRFLYYALGSTYIQGFVTGAVQPKLNQANMNNIPIYFPKKSARERIVETLGCLDDKIELNRQTNATLEAIAQAIFKEWFVDFNYPGATGEMVDSELGPIPIGWRVGKLGEVCELIKGVSYSSDELQPSNKALVTLKSINRGGGFNSSGFKEFNGKYKSSQCLVEGDLIFAQTDITQNADVIGSPAIVENPLGYERLIASLDIVKCIPVNEMPSSRTLFFFLQRQEFKDYCLSHTNGSTVLHLRSSEVPKYPMIIPCQRILRIFDSLAATLTQNVLENNKQNRILSEFRDKLLPKLMRGEIRL